MGTRRQITLEENPFPLLMSAATRRWADETPAMELWDAWVFAEVDTDLMLEAWYSAAPDDKGHAHAAYVAALDREEQAAASLAQRLGAKPERGVQHSLSGP